MEFQNVVKYHEVFLEKQRCPSINHLTFLIEIILAYTTPTRSLTLTSLDGPKILEHLHSLRMIRMYLLEKLQIQLVPGIVGIVKVGNTGIMSVIILENEKS